MMMIMYKGEKYNMKIFMGSTLKNILSPFLVFRFTL